MTSRRGRQLFEITRGIVHASGPTSEIQKQGITLRLLSVNVVSVRNSGYKRIPRAVEEESVRQVHPALSIAHKLDLDTIQSTDNVPSAWRRYLVTVYDLSTSSSMCVP